MKAGFAGGGFGEPIPATGYARCHRNRARNKTAGRVSPGGEFVKLVHSDTRADVSRTAAEWD